MLSHILYEANPHNKYRVAVLVKDTAFKPAFMKEYYFDPLHAAGLDKTDILGLNLQYNDAGKIPVSLIKQHLEDVLPACDNLDIRTLVVADAAYFKKLTGERKAEPHYGYILPCKIKGYEHFSVILTVNYQRLYHDPALKDKLDMSINTTVNHIKGTHVDIGENIIHSSEYSTTLEHTAKLLESLHQYPELTCDIETFSLDFNKAGIGTIAFAWDEHNGVAMAIDYTDQIGTSLTTQFGAQWNNYEAKQLLKQFFLTYKGKLTYHGGTFDIKILIYELFMKNLLDNEGVIKGLDCFYRNIDDTKLITYLATNTTAGNHLSLKHNAFEFAGNYAKDDIDDITRIPLNELLKYNLIDGLSTWYVKKKNLPIMIADKQQEIYDTIMVPSMKVITHMELTGMPMDPEAIEELHQLLSDLRAYHTKFLLNSQIVKDYSWKRQREKAVMANLLLKRKVKPIEDFKEDFNPASNNQVADLLHEFMGLPIIDKTPTKAASVGSKSIQKVLNQLKNQYNLTDEEIEP